MLEKSEGGFIKDVYDKYIESKLETKTKTVVITKEKVNVTKMKIKNKKKSAETNETVINEGSDDGDEVLYIYLIYDVVILHF